MIHKKIKSSMLDSVAYDPVTKTMEVLFLNGTKYHYHDVHPFHHESLMRAPSSGKYLTSVIQKKYTYNKKIDKK